jgi:hypothetical protein
LNYIKTDKNSIYCKNYDLKLMGCPEIFMNFLETTKVKSFCETHKECWTQKQVILCSYSEKSYLITAGSIM